MLASLSYGTVFDIASKLSLRAGLNEQMSKPGFWDNPERAQQTIGQLKSSGALLKPYEDLEVSVADLKALAELSDL